MKGYYIKKEKVEGDKYKMVKKELLIANFCHVHQGR
jgi:hypothetical protein